VDITLLPAHEQARLIADGELSSREMLDASVARYEHLDGELNAVIVERIDDARRAAADADAAVARGDELGPLHGIAMTVKEVIDWVGTPSTWGDPRHANNRPERNAVVLDQLLAAGAIVWGKTNVPLELGEWQTFNAIHGRTNNPWNLDRTPGGSSGGSAVALAVGYSGLEIGSDIGGSIRFPAHYCGVFGHKPSFGAVSADGHDYPGQPAEVDLNVVGPMARSARDLDLAMRVLTRMLLPEERRTELRDFTVGVMLEHPLGGEQDDEMTAVLQAGLDQLVDAGLNVRPVATGIDHARAQRNYLLLNHAATSAVDQSWHGQNRLAITHRQWIALNNERQGIRNQWADYFESVDLLLCPVAASAAPPHQTDVAFMDQTVPVNGRDVSNFDQWMWAGIASGAYLPSTAFPVGRASTGLPVGLQALAPFGHDLRSIAFASVCEDTLGGYLPPPLVSE
jgi:amidase